MMKKHVLLIAAMLIGLTSATVTAGSVLGEKELKLTKRYRYAQPIIFVERGVEFMVFPDGTFDFTDIDYATRRNLDLNRRTNARNMRSAPGRYNQVSFVERSPRTQIYYDRFGTVSMINGIRLHYDNQGKVRRIGSVDMGYQRGHGRLKQVGGLRVNYNNLGEIVHLRGNVNSFNAFSNNNPYLDRGDYFDCDDYDDDYYYYKKDGKRNKHKKRKRSKR